MTENTPEKEKVSKKGRKGDAASSKSRIWGEARKEIVPLSIGAIALVASSSVNQGMCERCICAPDTDFPLVIIDDLDGERRHKKGTVGTRDKALTNVCSVTFFFFILFYPNAQTTHCPIQPSPV